jgi:hypothetical protein
MASWMDTASYVAEDPVRVAVVIGLAQADQAMDELSLAQMVGILVQRIAGQAVETAVIVKHITDLASHALLERDESGFRWQLTPLGTLVSRQWAPGTVEPPGDAPLQPADIRAWRDRMLAQLDGDGQLADRAGIAREEMLVVQGARLTELRVLNRILAEDKVPAWLQSMVEQEGITDEK